MDVVGYRVQTKIPHVLALFMSCKTMFKFQKSIHTMTVGVVNIGTLLPRSDFKNEKIMRIFKHKNFIRTHNSARRHFPKWEKPNDRECGKETNGGLPSLLFTYFPHSLSRILTFVS